MQTILGIDCSSSTIGWAFIGVDNDKIKLLEHGHIKPPSRDGYSLIKRIDSAMADIATLCERLKPDYSIVEEIIQHMEGRTSANTIIVLAAFNKAVSVQLLRSTGKEPLFLLPISIRTRIKRFLQRADKIDKEEIPSILQDYFGKTFFNIVGYKQRGKNKGQPIVETYDEADAVAAAWAGVIELGLVKGTHE
jgi:Holliday junction resolvasome RuvABC endonuclease subunit